MAYSSSQMTEAVNALVAAIHGLHADVAKAWVTAEQGVNYNILGLTYTDSSGHQQLYKYTSYADGAKHIADFIYSSPYYKGIVNSLSGTSQQQAAAIIASPWNHPYYTTGTGAASLRAIAHGSTNTLPKLYTLVFRGRTPVHASAGGSILFKPTPIYSMTAIAEQHFVSGHWWYKIISAPLSAYVGKWVQANGHFSATPK